MTLSHVKLLCEITFKAFRYLLNFSLSSRPHTSGRDYVLMTTFPNKELTDETLTLAEAKLLNAVVVQKHK